MNLKRLITKGKKVVDQRGGMDALKEDAKELQKVAKSKGSLSDKAKRAAKAVKEPGARREQQAPGEEGRP